MKTFRDFLKEQNTLVDTGNTTSNLSRMLRMLDVLEPKDIADNMTLIMKIREKMEDMLTGSKSGY